MYTQILYIGEILLHAFLIYLLSRKWKKNRSLFFLALFNFSIILWIASVWLIGENHADPNVVWFVRLTFVSTTISVSSFVLFLRRHITGKFDTISKITTILALIIAPLSATDLVVAGAQAVQDTTFVPVDFGPLSLLYILYVVTGIIILLVSVLTYKRKTSGLEALRVTYLTTGIVIGGALALATNVILPIISGESNTAIWGPFAVSSVSIFATYSFVQNRLFSIKFITTKGIYYLILTLLPLAFIYAVLTTQKVLYESNYTQNAYILALLASIAFSAIYIKLKNFMEEKVFPILAFNRFNPDEIREEFARKVSTKLNINELGIETLTTIKKIYQLEKLGILIFNKNNSQIIYRALKNIDQTQFSARDLLQTIQYWNEIGRSTVLVREELKNSDYISDPRVKRILSVMDRYQLEVIMPLNRKVQLNGVILLGEKGDTSPYTVEDIRFLESLIVNASVAFGRAILYQQVEEFSQSLQSKVNEQTKELQIKVKELEEARKKEADMIDIMGHELRTPATIVKLNADLLHSFIEKVPEDKETFNKYVTRIKDAVENEIKLINTLLSSAKLEGDKIEIRQEEVNTYNEIDMAVHGEENRAKAKGLELINTVAKEIPNIYADHARVVEVLNNLISNAVKYTEKGSVTVSAQDLGQLVEISVTDTGRGISQEDINKLGTKFFRTKTYIESEDSDEFDIVRPGGTGLGLYVSFNLIRKMGGDINVSSEIGKGSVFSFTLPKYTNQDSNSTKNENNDMFAKLGLKN